MSARTPWQEAIIQRVERVREDHGMSRHLFAGYVSVKRQRYEHYLRPDGSRPSLDLVLGVIEAFAVEPRWLLLGQHPQDHHTEEEPIYDDAARADL